MTFTTSLAIWASVLSTILAIIKIWEIYKNRFRITSSIEFDSFGERKTIVSIYNHFKDPIIITGLDLFWSKSLRNETDAYHPETGYEQGCNLSIGSNGFERLIFEEMYYFGHRKDKGKLYLSLQIAGRKSDVVMQLFPYNK